MLLRIIFSVLFFSNNILIFVDLWLSILVLDWTFNSSKNLSIFIVNLYSFCSSPGVGVVIRLVYSLVALEQVFHCDSSSYFQQTWIR
jgi:hypothetical protein